MTDFVTVDGYAIIHSAGVYAKRALAALDGALFARHGSGYVRLYGGGGTSRGKVAWVHISVPHEATDQFNRILAPVGATAMEAR